MEISQGAAISPSLRTLTRVPYASGDTAAPLLFLVQSEKYTTDRSTFEDFPETPEELVEAGSGQRKSALKTGSTRNPRLFSRTILINPI
jgi:hypothetical protein